MPKKGKLLPCSERPAHQPDLFPNRLEEKIERKRQHSFRRRMRLGDALVLPTPANHLLKQFYADPEFQREWQRLNRR
jgi:hypothetical protein